MESTLKMEQVFRNNLKFFLQLREMSQTDLAKKMNVSKVQIGRLFNGQTTPTFDSLSKIADALEIPPYLLIWDSVNPNQDSDFVESAKEALEKFSLAQEFSKDDGFRKRLSKSNKK